MAVPGGGEAAIHASRSFVTNMTEDEIFVKLDFANAFNTLQRDIMLQMVYDTIPEIYEFTHQTYSADSQLQFGPPRCPLANGTAAGGSSGSTSFLPASATSFAFDALGLQDRLSRRPIAGRKER